MYGEEAFPKSNIFFVDSMNSGDMYSWGIFGVWMKKDTKQLFYATDGGCSCDSPWDMLESSADLTPGTLNEIKNKARGWADKDIASQRELSDFIKTLENVVK